MRMYKKHLFALLLVLTGAGLLLPQPLVSAADVSQEATCESAVIHYRRRNADYEGWGLHVWGATPLTNQVTWQEPLAPSGEDDYGIYWQVPMEQGAEALNYIVHKGDTKDPGPDQSLVFAEKGCEIWLIQGRADQFTDPDQAIAAMTVNLKPAPEPTETTIIIHYRRTAEDYDGFGLHVWGPTPLEGVVTWTNPLLPAGQDEYGIYWIVDVNPDAEFLNYIVHRGDEKDPGPDQKMVFAEVGREIWLIQGSGEQFTDPEQAKEGLLVAGVGDIKNKAQAHWLTREYIAWPVPFGDKAQFTLFHDPDGKVKVTQQGLEGGQQVSLQFVDDDLPKELAQMYPHLSTAVLLKIPDEYLDDVPEWLKGQVALQVTAPDGAVLGATALQLYGVLDDLYANDEALGVVWEGDTPTLRLWAPTAGQVNLLLFSNVPSASRDEAVPEMSLPMRFDPQTGIWSLTGTPEWKGMYYLYEVWVYVRQEGKVVGNRVTDPYSVNLSMNSQFSQIINLDDPDLKPAGWDAFAKPLLVAPEDIVLYELHIRDFSARDESVPQELRGTYLAFTMPDSNGVKHLKSLAQAGVTHVHLLPTFDIATIDENKENWEDIDFAYLASLPPDSEEQQAMISQIRGKDGYNWGYDPYHYNTPEGSYSTDPNSTARIVEFRQMVMALNQMGLRVVMDVVYNHTNASGLSDKSVLDKIVPGYYHRLDDNGNVTSSTCCANTATEHKMMEKLMRDSVLLWATAYKVDGFRFDLMGHHMKDNMLSVRQALNSLTLANDGVDGHTIYIYGEGWNFGEVADNARGVNATQLNMAGTGIGTFNDRIRDAVRGGNPFKDVREQGFATGLYTYPNQANQLPEQTQLALLLDLQDQIRVSLAGNLADFPLLNAEGIQVTGKEVGYNGQPAGYTADPQENILYVSAHDNETLFDAIVSKAAPDLSIDQLVRIQNLALDLVMYGQGVPFFHAGSEILRSKSGDRDSYDSGDWYNAIDWTYQDNNWGHGLPPAEKNAGNWTILAPLLANPALKPGQGEIQTALNHFLTALAIRKSSPLFRLQTAEQVISQVAFLNTGPQQIPGLIVMRLMDNPDARLDPNYDQIYVLFNANPETVNYTLNGENIPKELSLHPLLVNGTDEVVKKATYDGESGTFTIPGRTTAVFLHHAKATVKVEENTPESQIQLPVIASSKGESGAGLSSISLWVFGFIAGLIGIAIYLISRFMKKNK